jgi:hypothetical protein
VLEQRWRQAAAEQQAAVGRAQRWRRVRVHQQVGRSAGASRPSAGESPEQRAAPARAASRPSLLQPDLPTPRYAPAYRCGQAQQPPAAGFLHRDFGAAQGGGQSLPASFWLAYAPKRACPRQHDVRAGSRR